MEKAKAKIWEKGIIIGLILIVLNLIIHFTHQDDNSALGLLGSLIFIVAVIIATILYSKQQNGQVTFGNLFAHGFKVSAVVTLIMILWIVLSYKVLFPEIPERIIEMQRVESLKSGVSEADMNKVIGFTKKYFTTLAVGGSLLFYAFLGLISSLLGAAFSKKVPANSSPFQQQ